MYSTVDYIPRPTFFFIECVVPFTVALPSLVSVRTFYTPKRVPLVALSSRRCHLNPKSAFWGNFIAAISQLKGTSCCTTYS